MGTQLNKTTFLEEADWLEEEFTDSSNTRISVTLDLPGERIDRALSLLVPDLSRTQWQTLIKEGLVTLNGRSLKASYIVAGHEVVEAILPHPVQTDLLPENIPLDIRYEDDDLLLINKPAGLVVHPGAGHFQGTLVNALLAYCPSVMNVGGERRPGIVHRLDKDTSGLILVAKNDRALRYVQDQFKRRTIHKIYLALVEGVIQPAAGLIDAPIGRDTQQRRKMRVYPVHSPLARPAQTQFESKTVYERYTLLTCRLLTGRTHQIRVHLAYLGYPIVGDAIYGRRKQTLLPSRHFLHAAELSFKRPFDGQELTFKAELPPDLQTLLDGLE